MEVRATAPCRHCGNPSPGASEFCCVGCEGAYRIINDSCGPEFYRIRGQTQISPVRSNRFIEPVTSDDIVRVSSDYEKVEFSVQGVECSACIWLIEKISKFSPEVVEAKYNPFQRTVTVLSKTHGDWNTVTRVFEQFGFHIKPLKAGQTELSQKEFRSALERLAFAFASMIGTMHVSLTLLAGILTSMNPHMVQSLGLITMILSLPGLLFAAIPFYRNALGALRFGRLNIDALVSMTILTGFAMSVRNILNGKNETYFDALTMLVFLLIGARFFLSNMERRFQKADFDFGSWIQKRRASVGDVVEVLSGQFFPCDGVLVAGNSQSNNSWFTGESEPQPIHPGSEVWAGSSNIGAAVKVRVIAVGASTRAGTVLKKFESLQKPDSVSFSETSESYLILGLLAFCISLGVYKSLHGGDVFPTIVSLLLVTCPCALGIAVPSIFGAATLQARAQGIWIKNGTIFEKLLKVKTVVFDKTGTLTENRARLDSEKWDIQAIQKMGFELTPLKETALGIASMSSHILCRALVPLRNVAPIDVTEIFGQGLVFKEAGHEYRLGRRSFVGPKSESPVFEASNDLPHLYFSVDQNAVAVFGFENELRRGALDLISHLKSKFRVLIISGDHKAAVTSLGHRLGLSSEAIFSDCDSIQKLSLVNQHTSAAQTMMVGDGINDLLALKGSAVGVALQGTSDHALPFNDIYLPTADLGLIRNLIEAAPRVRRATIAAYSWVLLYNSLAIYLVLQNYIGPLICAILMPLSSITVVFLAFRYSYFKRSTP